MKNIKLTESRRPKPEVTGGFRRHATGSAYVKLELILTQSN